MSKAEKKVTIRSAGLQTEKKFFGPRGVFAKAGHRGHLKKNPITVVGNPKKKAVRWEPPQPWENIAEDTSTKEPYVLAGDGNVYGYSGSSYGGPWSNEGTLEEFTAKVNGGRYRIRWIKKNPITVVGNPSKRINATIAGVLYNRCIEVVAEATIDTPEKEAGVYYHPYGRKAQVCVLALDSGDILLHSRNGTNLWKPIT